MINTITPQIYYNEKVMDEHPSAMEGCYTMILPLHETDYDGLYANHRVQDHYEYNFGAGKNCFRAVNGLRGNFALTKNQVVQVLTLFDKLIRGQFELEVALQFDCDEMPRPQLQYDKESIKQLHWHMFRLWMAAEFYEEKHAVQQLTLQQMEQQKHLLDLAQMKAECRRLTSALSDAEDSDRYRVEEIDRLRREVNQLRRDAGMEPVYVDRHGQMKCVHDGDAYGFYPQEVEERMFWIKYINCGLSFVPEGETEDDPI